MSGRRTPPPILEHNGQRHTLYEWAHIVGLEISTVRERLARGWSVDEALTIPSGGKRLRDVFCNGCQYQGQAGAMLFCDYLGMTGRPRTVRGGVKVDLCPRREGGET